MEMVSDENFSDETFELLQQDRLEKDLECCFGIHPINSVNIIDVEKRRVFSANIENADNVLVKFNELTRQGKILKNAIIIFRALHMYAMTKNIAYHPDVTKFFGLRIHSGVRSTYNVICRGPMICG